jgi:hypothetical protein
MGYDKILGKMEKTTAVAVVMTSYRDQGDDFVGGDLKRYLKVMMGMTSYRGIWSR